MQAIQQSFSDCSPISGKQCTKHTVSGNDRPGSTYYILVLMSLLYVFKYSMLGNYRPGNLYMS